MLDYKEFQLNEKQDQSGKMSSENEEKFIKLFKDDKPKLVNLNKLAHDITMTERGKESVDITQVKEMIAIFGDRWRKMKFIDIMSEIYAIIDRAG
jgi:hypothetical protein